MQHCLSKFALCVLGLLSADCTFAYLNTDNEHNARGFYVGVDLGYGFENTKFEYTDYDIFDDSYTKINQWQYGTHGFAIGASIGYQFNAYFAIELDSLNTVLASNAEFDRINKNYYYDAYSDPVYAYVGIASKFYIPLNDKFRLITKVGAGGSAFGYTKDGYYGSVDYAEAFGAFQGALGLAYFVDQHSEFDLNSTVILSKNVYGRDGLTVMNFVTLGYSYHF